MTSSNGNILLVATLYAGNSPVTGVFPLQTPVRSFDVFFDLRLTKRLNKESTRWWFETPSRLLWRHCNELLLYYLRVVSPMMTPWHRNALNVIGPLIWESTGSRWIPLTKSVMWTFGFSQVAAQQNCWTNSRVIGDLRRNYFHIKSL